MWFFGKECNGIDIYIKIALGEPRTARSPKEARNYNIEQQIKKIGGYYE